MIKELNSTARRIYPRLVKFLREIVTIPSPSGKEGMVSSRIRREMKDAGFDEVDVDGLGSVIARLGSGKTRILYDAHIDTVDAGSIEKWKYDPYGAVYRHGILYGRGACDDKGGVAALVYAARLIRMLGLGRDCTLYFSLSALEEPAQGEGIMSVMAKIGVKPHCVVIAEPSGLKIVRGHKGRAGFKITAKGKSSHASTPEKGINAIYRMTPLLRKIDELNKKFRLDSRLGRSVISVTGIKSQSNLHNTIPDNCVIYLDRRTTEKEGKQKVTAELKRIAGKHGRVEESGRFSPAWILERKHPLLESAQRAYRILFSKEPELCLWPFCTNGSYTMGERRIPTIGFGPGEDRFAHVTDERIKTEDVLKAAMFYAVLPRVIEGAM